MTAVPITCVIPEEVPSLIEFYEGLSNTDTVLLSIAAAVSFAVVLLGVIHSYYISRYVLCYHRKTKMYFLSWLYPMLAIICICGMAAPRTAVLLISFGVLFILFALYNAIALYRVSHGSREDFSDALMTQEVNIALRKPPCCCCMPCLPTIKPTVQNILRIERLVLQATLVRLVIQFVCVLAVCEFGQASDHYIPFIDLFGVPSLIFAIFGGHVTGGIVTEFVTRHKLTTIFRFVDITLALFTAQLPLIFHLLLGKGFGIFSCGPMLSPENNARFIFFFVMLIELLLLSLFVTYTLCPEKCELFDGFYDRPNRSNTKQSHQLLPLEPKERA